MIAVTGYSTTIVRELEQLLPLEVFVRIDMDLAKPDCPVTDIPRAERYLLAAGVLHQKHILEQSAAEMIEAVSVNLLCVIRISEAILARDSAARICIIGSESGSKGSFNQVYAACKAAVNAYIVQRRTQPLQQLVCVSPPIISDSGMTRRRKDYPQILEQRPTVRAIDVARTVKRVLYDREPQKASGCIVRVIP